jgi:hypothetical protein
MNTALQAILARMLNRRIIGAKHLPEDKLIKMQWLNKNERKEFLKEYREMVNQGIIIISKKKTGKGSANHISLNPAKIKEAIEMIS